MARKRLLTKKEFIKAYRKAKNARELTIALNMSLPTVYLYVKRYNLSLFDKGGDRVDPLEIAKYYWGDTTISGLAKELNLTSMAIRYHLRKLVWYPDKYPLTTKDVKSDNYLPPPKKIFHIRIINTLKKYPKCIDWPVRLTWHGIPKYQIKDYWQYAFNQRADFRDED